MKIEFESAGGRKEKASESTGVDEERKLSACDLLSSKFCFREKKKQREEENKNGKAALSLTPRDRWRLC